MADVNSQKEIHEEQWPLKKSYKLCRSCMMWKQYHIMSYHGNTMAWRSVKGKMLKWYNSKQVYNSRWLSDNVQDSKEEDNKSSRRILCPKRLQTWAQTSHLSTPAWIDEILVVCKETANYKRNLIVTYYSCCNTMCSVIRERYTPLTVKNLFALQSLAPIVW